MKKLIVPTMALAVLLVATSASAATHIVRIGVDADQAGFVYTYNGIHEDTCLDNDTPVDCEGHCINWWTDVLPTVVYGIHARIYKDNSSKYYLSDWDAFRSNGFEENPDFTSTYVPATGNRVYEMSHYWDESQYYWYNRPFARFDYYYYSSSPKRCRFLYLFPEIE